MSNSSIKASSVKHSFTTTATKNVQRLHVRIQNNYKQIFQVDGAFPAYISEINTTEKRLHNVDIQQGDHIISINGQNVSRASARSVKKIIRSSVELVMILQRPELPYCRNNSVKQSNNVFTKLFNKIKCRSIVCVKPPVNTTISCDKNETAVVVTEEIVDQGYISDPSCVFKQTSSSSLSTSSSKSSGFCETEVHDHEEITQDIKALFISYLENFITNIQLGIEAYVRPSLVLNILTQSECFELYQNIEKLVVVAKFLLNIIDQYESMSLVNVDSLNIVFTVFKTYLDGLCDAMGLLGHLTCQNDNFNIFVEKSKAMPIVDFLFMPFSFVCRLIDYFEEANKGDQKLSASIQKLYECMAITQVRLEQRYQDNEDSLDSQEISYL